MKALNSLRKLSTKTMKTLGKHFAVDARIYYPGKVRDKNINGHNDIAYRDEPSWQGSCLCPSYFKYRDYLNSSILDPFQETPDIIMWTDIQDPFPLYSKVIFDTDYNGITTFKIDKIITESDDEGNFIHKHYLVPMYEVQKAHNIDNIKAELFDDKQITDYDETRDTTNEHSEVSKFVYNPIK